ncbi:MAG: hypothetical protein EOP06_18715 [Proteobacteria bacterium]|nr:MAG: hypothetical protein EOP06_18715 [Pseudomonadota bacterium]
MKKLLLSYMMRKLALKQAGTQQFGRGVRIKRMGPIGGLIAMALLAIMAVIGLIGFVVAGAAVTLYAVGRRLLSAPKDSPQRREPTITVLDPNGKTVAEVPRTA